MSADAELPLSGGRKKPEPRPRTEGLVRLAHRRGLYVRLYAPSSKRAVYRATGREDLRTAEQLLPHLRAQLGRDVRRHQPPRNAGGDR